MSKIIITTHGDVRVDQALMVVNEVVKDGFVSENNTQYCYLTTFLSGLKVYADKTKAGTWTFKVWKSK
jgi:hypothetical protein